MSMRPIAILGLALASVVWADEPPSKRVLFDGKTLDGWKRVESYKAGAVKVADGAIVLEAGGPMSAVVSTRTDLPKLDYELAFEARRVDGKDFFAAATFPVGDSFVTLVNGGWGGRVTGLSSINGSDASENDTRRDVKYEDDTWYRFRVQVTAEVIRCWIDDKETFATNYRGVQVKTRIETRPHQPLGFASYRTTGAVRAVDVRKLTEAEVAATNKAAEG